VGEDFRFAEFPVGGRQHHHRIGAVGFGERARRTALAVVRSDTLTMVGTRLATC
jgi:hypothetical protein